MPSAIPWRQPHAPTPALEKVATKKLQDGSPAHSFHTLLNNLSTIVRNTCRRKNPEEGEQTFEIDITPTTKQREALRLIGEITL